MDCSPPDSFVHGLFQARILEWVAISVSKGIFLTQGLNRHLLNWQADSLLLGHQGSPKNKGLLQLYSYCSYCFIVFIHSVHIVVDTFLL